MHGCLNPAKRILLPLRRRAATTRLHFCFIVATVGGDDDYNYQPPWTAANQLFERHPRLLFLERCHSRRRLDPILAYTIVSGLFRNPFVASRILHFSTSTSPPDLSLALSVFSQMTLPNLFSWNSMIKALAANSTAALSLFVEMRRNGVSPDKYTLPFLLMSFTSIDDLDNGRSLHSTSFVFGYESNLFVQTGLVSMYLECGYIEEALHLFDEMPSRDVVTWTALISGMAGQGCYDIGLTVLNEMRNDDPTIRPNTATMASAISACAGLGSLNHTKNLHGYLVKTGFGSHVFVMNSLVDAYAKCGSVARAHQVFNAMSERDLHSWTVMVMALALNGLGREAIRLLSEMGNVGISPDSATFLAVLSACSHSGLLDEGTEIFESMEGEFGIQPDLKHYGCIVDLFARAGHLSCAYEFISSMPMEPNLDILGTLLSACSVHGNLKLGELVSRKIESSMRRCPGGASVILSNMYASSGHWQEVISIRKGRREEGGKLPGRSWIEVRGVVHEFVVGDRLHPLAKEIVCVLNGVGKLMESIA